MCFIVSTNIGTENILPYFNSSRKIILPSSFCDFDLFNNLTQTGAYEFLCNGWEHYVPYRCL
jgi:hypothetical protein